ncbi:MAG: hypothetical protein ABW168_17090 [Sedimenticola sp.]
MSDYHPISCELHSRNELLAIEQRIVRLRLKGKDKQLAGVRKRSEKKIRTPIT